MMFFSLLFVAQAKSFREGSLITSAQLRQWEENEHFHLECQLEESFEKTR